MIWGEIVDAYLAAGVPQARAEMLASSWLETHCQGCGMPIKPAQQVCHRCGQVQPDPN